MLHFDSIHVFSIQCRWAICHTIGRLSSMPDGCILCDDGRGSLRRWAYFTYMSSLGWGTLFGVTDLHHAHLQMEVEEQSRPFTINTTCCLYQYQCLPYGVALAPAICQHSIECHKTKSKVFIWANHRKSSEPIKENVSESGQVLVLVLIGS